MPRTIRYDRREDLLIFGARTRKQDGNGVFYGHIDDLAGRPAVDLQAALRAVCHNWDADYAGMYVSEVDASYFDDEDSPVEPVSFGCHSGQLTIEIDFMQDSYEDDDVTATSRTRMRPG